MPTLYTRKSFLWVEYPLEEADVCFLSIPFDSTTTGFSTSKLAPFCIKECLKNKEGYDIKTEINPFRKLKMCDLGELEIVPGNFKLTSERIRETVKKIFEVNSKILLIILGGEHLITLPIIESFKERFDLVQFDAHRDFRKDYLGSKYAHNTWAFHASKLKNCKKITQFGIRSYSEEEKKIKINEDLSKVSEPLYITFDMDVFDPSIAPEVNNPEANGLFFEEVERIFRELCRKRIIGLDVVECCATSPLNITATTAADLILKFLCYYVKFHK
jgi:agmatinase